MTNKTNEKHTVSEQRTSLPQWVLPSAPARNVLESDAPANWAQQARAKILDAVQKRALEAPPTASNTRPWEQDGRDTVRRVLQALFSDKNPDNAVRFRRAMETSEQAAAAVLAEFNVENGRQLGEPNFNDNQYLGLSEILFSEQFAPIAPVEEDGATVKRQVLHFWTELLSKQTAQVEDFHLRVSDYAVDRNDDGKCQRVLKTLRQYAPEGTWSREHVDALAEINTQSIEFKGLAWLHFPGVIW